MNKKMKKQIRKIVLGIVFLIGLLILDGLGIIDIQENSVVETNSYVDSSSTILYDVVRVVDGDTIVIDYNKKEEKVRLIGVDTPESVHPTESKNTEEGIKTSNYTKEMLTGKKVGIELDVQERDKYGRILAYVYLDGEMYNMLLLKKGYAKVATYPPNVKYVDEFTKLQEIARNEKIGLWAEEEK